MSPQSTATAASLPFDADHTHASIRVNSRLSIERRIRILFLIDQLSALGGGERALAQIVRNLPARFHCKVVTLRGNVHPNIEKLLPVPVQIVPLKRTYTPGAIYRALQLRHIIRTAQIDIVHTFFETADLWGGLVAKLSGAKAIISSRRDMGLLRSLKHRLAYPLASPMYDRVLTVSDAVRGFVIHDDRMLPDRVKTLYTGVAPFPEVTEDQLLGIRARLGIPSSAPVVAKVANILPWKGHIEFLRCAARVHADHPDAHFVVAGAHTDATLYASLLNQRKALGMDDYFHFLGDCSSVAPLYRLASVVCLLSQTEGLPNVLLEAMSAGKPVVATRAGGTPEVVVDGETGFLVDVGDIEAAASKVSVLLGSRVLASKMSWAAADRAEKVFSLTGMIAQLEGVYDSALHGK